ncbi:MAG: indolepyruvate oxidoreductase subunit beta [Phycisphaerae bacterium]|nr:indolepyruvate oxidoreductase subunit beta [Phycisphaerae bacterium]
MEFNIILAGVGGQGILTTAQAISLAAMRRGLRIKQSEVHGMSQRGGAVQAHLRMADREIYSDLIPLGAADMVLAVEPMEALRYVQMLNETGVIVANTEPLVNIPNYGRVEQVLEDIAKYPRHVLLDADRLASAAGSARAMNMVILGAASVFIDIPPADFEVAIAEMFARKGSKLIDMNLQAFSLGRNAASVYREGLLRGADSHSVRQWISSIPTDELDGGQPPEPAALRLFGQECDLSEAETTAVAQMLKEVERDNRRQLYEHEVYRAVELIGAISPPRHVFIPAGMTVTAETLAPFPGDKVVLKIVSPDIVHKSDVDAVVFAPKHADIVSREIEALIKRQGEHTPRIAGVLIVEFVEHGGQGFGKELFVGIRSTREFGPVIAAGLGGVDTEYLAQKLKPGLAVAKAVATDTTAEEFLDSFKKTAAYEILSGQARGHNRITADGELLRCFRAFIAIARRFCIDRGMEGPDLGELEVNPFAFRQQMMVPLDGRGRLATATKQPPARPISKIGSLLEPKSAAILGVSTKRENFGRIILKNVISCGFPTDRLYVIKDQMEPLDGVRCVPGLKDLPDKVDLLILAAAAKDMPVFIDEVIDSGKVASVIIIPGGLGEKEGTEDAQEQIRRTIAKSRERADGGPIFLGPNCMGLRSRPGLYDTFFIPSKNLDPRRDAPPRRAAIISQSGAFIITRMSNLVTLDPTFAISIGNQIDLTVSDMLRATGQRDDLDAIGVYVEGFKDLDGIAFVRAVEEVAATGKVVIFYKAGRTDVGRSATAGHTASIAGDYDICQTAVANAGAIVTETFKEFEQLMELATALHGKKIGGRRVGAISNAGYETVGMADAILGPRYQVEIPKLSDATAASLTETLTKHKLNTLVNARNPLDVTPMASDQAYEDCVRVFMRDDALDAIVASFVPLTPEMLTTSDEICDKGSIAHRLAALFRESPKPLIVVIDSGPTYEPLAYTIRAAGVPVFRSSDQAIRSLGLYLCHR